jgi:hypothetical protein
MLPHRLIRLEVQGFRSFGKVRQTMDLPETIAVFWGGNSQGKTSLAEALEFLFSGQIARRELLASAKDEFTEAIRNVHIQAADLVSVEADIRCPDGKIQKLTRVLVEDYKRGNAVGCTSKLSINGKACQESDILANLGIRLSHPPLRAPILGQHTLGYLFSASPTDRAAFFRAVLDTQDLEDFRSLVAGLQSGLVAPLHAELSDLAEVEATPVTSPTAKLVRKAADIDKLRAKLRAVTAALITHAGLLPATTLSSQVAQLEEELERRRSRAFPLDLLRRGVFSPPADNSKDVLNGASSFLAERAKVDAETQRLLALFKAALALPPHPHVTETKDCPLCGAVDTFTESRVSFIKSKVQSADAYVVATEGFAGAMSTKRSQLAVLLQSTCEAIPRVMRDGLVARRKAGFTVPKMQKLLGTGHPAIQVWTNAVRKLVRAGRQLEKKIEKTQSVIDVINVNRDVWEAHQELEDCLLSFQAAQAAFSSRLAEYEQPAKALGEALKPMVDQSAEIKGWEPLIRIASNPDGLWAALISAAKHAAELKALEKAVREIDAGNGKVLDEKFSDLSDEVLVWWEKLRPDETTFFSAVQRRGEKTKRTIDLKVGLSEHEDRSNPKFRDAVAVFSQSQLHCLGLSIFLARAVQEKTGFVIMDDPVLTSDDDYRPNFTTTVMHGLLDKEVQVIICTQDHKSWKDIGTHWSHRGVVQFNIVKNDPIIGTEIRSENDDLAALIARAAPLTKSPEPQIRKEAAVRLRTAIERFCKEMLVKDHKANGNKLTLVSDYDGKNFGEYGQAVMNMLTLDGAHSGKLKAAHAYVTPGPHDDKPPSKGELAMALGDLRKLKKEYLG